MDKTDTFTGYCGEKDLAIRNGGEIFYVFEQGDGSETLIIARDEQDFKRLLDEFDWIGWTKMLAMSWQEALLKYQDAHDQWEAKENEDPNWKEIVNIPEGDRF